MKAIVIFEREGEILHRFERQLREPGDYDGLVEAAHQSLRDDRPDVDILDGVTVTYDKED